MPSQQSWVSAALSSTIQRVLRTAVEKDEGGDDHHALDLFGDGLALEAESVVARVAVERGVLDVAEPELGRVDEGPGVGGDGGEDEHGADGRKGAGHGAFALRGRALEDAEDGGVQNRPAAEDGEDDDANVGLVAHFAVGVEHAAAVARVEVLRALGGPLVERGAVGIDEAHVHGHEQGERDGQAVHDGGGRAAAAPLGVVVAEKTFGHNGQDDGAAHDGAAAEPVGGARQDANDPDHADGDAEEAGEHRLAVGRGEHVVDALVVKPRERHDAEQAVHRVADNATRDAPNVDGA